jgi:hypothetical protein
MKNENKSVNAEPFRFSKKIGSTVYNVVANFSQTGKETMEDKMLRLIENEARNTTCLCRKEV